MTLKVKQLITQPKEMFDMSENRREIGLIKQVETWTTLLSPVIRTKEAVSSCSRSEARRRRSWIPSWNSLLLIKKYNVNKSKIYEWNSPDSDSWSRGQLCPSDPCRWKSLRSRLWVDPPTLERLLGHTFSVCTGIGMLLVQSTGRALHSLLTSAEMITQI